MKPLKRVVLDRLIRYYRYLADRRADDLGDTITSARIGRALDVDPSQVRKDFGAIGLVGMSHVGYDVCEVCRGIRTAVGFDEPYAAFLIGAGKLGGAILASDDFDRYGLRVVAAFDKDPFKVGRRVGPFAIQPLEDLPRHWREMRPRLAIVTVPASQAQAVADLVVHLGVEAIWNFTPTRLAVPDGVLVRNERISAGLAEIAYHLRPGAGEEDRSGAARLTEGEAEPTLIVK